jgi:glycosyltransferase involved in cell wall biosynthesis
LLFTTGDSTTEVPRQWVLPVAEGSRIGNSVAELHHVIHAYKAVREFDIVHDHTVLGPIYAERFPELPVVTTIHGALDASLGTIYEHLAGRVPLIAVSANQADSATGFRVRVIHHGLDAAAFPFRCWEGRYCVFLGRMDPTKGAHRAVEVARRAGVPLLLAGKMRAPSEREYFEAQVKPQLDRDRRYLGEVDQDRKLQLLAGARCLLFPIRWREPFGLVMLEAMACGTPVLAFPEGAAPEVVTHGQNGFLCQDETEMVEALGRVEDLDRSACRAAVEGYFSAQRMVAEHLQLFEDLVGKYDRLASAADRAGAEAPSPRKLTRDSQPTQ